MLDCVGRTRFQKFLKGVVAAAYAARLPIVCQCSSYCFEPLPLCIEQLEFAMLVWHGVFSVCAS